MKKNFLYSMILMLATIFVTSCKDDSTEGLTRITYYPSITLLDGNVTVVNVGETYAEPGININVNYCFWEKDALIDINEIGRAHV